ncbi:MAG: hypothetical protein EBW96_08405 [Actinobacteria bacterium]|nr:hypothetical protein [Actinomycetota bacterium]
MLALLPLADHSLAARIATSTIWVPAGPSKRAHSPMAPGKRVVESCARGSVTGVALTLNSGLLRALGGFGETLLGATHGCQMSVIKVAHLDTVAEAHPVPLPLKPIGENYATLTAQRHLG